MKNSFDPLILVIKGNQEIKDAYNAGVNFGREKEREISSVKTKDLFSWIEKRIKEIEIKVLPQKKREWYIAGYKDTRKMIKSLLK